MKRMGYVMSIVNTNSLENKLMHKMQNYIFAKRSLFSGFRGYFPRQTVYLDTSKLGLGHEGKNNPRDLKNGSFFEVNVKYVMKVTKKSIKYSIKVPSDVEIANRRNINTFS